LAEKFADVLPQHTGTNFMATNKVHISLLPLVIREEKRKLPKNQSAACQFSRNGLQT
jgi:hypothetical protein